MAFLHLVSLGCTKNLVDSEIMLGRLKAYELTDDIAIADVIIVNTCGFIDAAKTESIETILSLHKGRKEGSILVMAGCLSQRYRDELRSELPEVDIFTGVGDYAAIDRLIAERSSQFSDHVFLQTEEERVVSGSSYHAYIKISEGCNQQCSFCAIPQFKGKLHSRTIESITKEITALTKKGYFDFTLIAQDSSSYGRDLAKLEGLSDLIGAIDKIEAVKIARICYLYPTTTSKKLIETIAKSRKFANYFDMPIQHASERMLKLMKRGLNAAATFDLVREMRNASGAYIRTAFIIGHPAETDEDFAEICRVIESGIFDRIALFAFSDEEQTAAYEMNDKVDPETIKNRLKIAQKLLAKMHKQKLKALVGKKLVAIIEGASSETEHLIAAKLLTFAPEIDPEIVINESIETTLKTGDLVEVEITQIAKDQIIARIVAKATL
ncbi:ribosomal protein S12 methylthiotransferase RimO [Campylobacterota bacterium]|nr:ribosomal protein S12 methylthiotransferase RimO [Campylobacterota bacterium]